MPNSRLQAEIAAIAAQLIAEFNEDYTSAKRKAARRILGVNQREAEVLPSNEMVQQALQEYQALYQAEVQPVRLLALRRIALSVMQLVPQHSLFLVGAVANGHAGEYSEIFLQCYSDSSKEIHIDLLNSGIDAGAEEIPNPFGKGRVERLRFAFSDEIVNITCYSPSQARQIGTQLTHRIDHIELQRSLTGE